MCCAPGALRRVHSRKSCVWLTLALDGLRGTAGASPVAQWTADVSSPHAAAWARGPTSDHTLGGRRLSAHAPPGQAPVAAAPSPNAAGRAPVPRSVRGAQHSGCTAEKNDLTNVANIEKKRPRSLGKGARSAVGMDVQDCTLFNPASPLPHVCTPPTPRSPTQSVQTSSRKLGSPTRFPLQHGVTRSKTGCRPISEPVGQHQARQRALVRPAPAVAPRQHRGPPQLLVKVVRLAPVRLAPAQHCAAHAHVTHGWSRSGVCVAPPTTSRILGCAALTPVRQLVERLHVGALPPQPGVGARPLGTIHVVAPAATAGTRGLA